MRTPPLNLEQLLRAKHTVNDITLRGFLINVENSFKAGLIDREQMNILLKEFLLKN